MTNVTFPQDPVRLLYRRPLEGGGGNNSWCGHSKETRTFNTFMSCLTKMKEWLLANGITHVAMVSTGVELKKLGYKVRLEKNEATKT